MFLHPRNITRHLHVLFAEFAANSRRLYTSSLASIHSCFSPVFQLYKTYFSWFRGPKMVEPILYRIIARVKRHLVAKFECNIQANTEFVTLYADTEMRSVVIE